MKIPLLDMLVVVVPVLTVAGIVAFSTMDRGDVEFDSEKWRAEASASPTCGFLPPASIRSRMTNDLARILLQTTPRPGKRDVEQMLGEPDGSKTQGLWSYRAGASTMDCLTFDVVFDQSGVVAGARRVQH